MISRSTNNVSTAKDELATGEPANQNAGSERSPGCSNKENSKQTSVHIRNLSPVDVITLSSEEVNEKIHNPLPQRTFKQPGLAATNKLEANKLLRRSVFKQNTFESTDDIPVCSTPMSNHHHSTRYQFFQENRGNLVNNLSPISAQQMNDKSKDSSKVLPGRESSKCIVEINPVVKIAQVRSIAAIENDLRNQYEITDISPLRKTKSRGNVPVTCAIENSPSRQLTKDCRIVVQKMELENHSISQYRQDQCRRLSVQNQTDVNSVRMVETPILRNGNLQKSSQSDSLLVAKLRLCEESLELTSEEDITDRDAAEEVPVQLSLQQSHQNVASKQTSFKNNNIRRTLFTHQPSSSKESCSKGEQDQSLSDTNTSCSKIVSSEVIQSFRSLPKRRKEVELAVSQRELMKITVPAKKRKTSLLNNNTYRNITLKKSVIEKPDGSKKKRTLFSPDIDNSFTTNLSKLEVTPNAPSNSDGVQDKPVEKNISTNVQVKKSKKVMKKIDIQPVTVSPETLLNDDEGFISENSRNEKNDVVYDPYEKGCLRPGLRVRRYAKAYWINNGEAQKYGIVVDGLNSQQSAAERKLKTRMKNSGIRENQFLQSTLDGWMKPTDKLKMFDSKKSTIQNAPAASKALSKKGSRTKSKTNNVKRKAAASNAASAVESGITTKSFGDSFNNLLQVIRNHDVGTQLRVTPVIQCDSFGKITE